VSRSARWFSASAQSPATPLRAPLRGDLCCLRLSRALGYLVDGPLYQLILVQRAIDQHWSIRVQCPKAVICGYNGRDSPTRRELKLFWDVYTWGSAHLPRRGRLIYHVGVGSFTTWGSAHLPREDRLVATGGSAPLLRVWHPSAPRAP
jgi:hypothetical protein